MRSKPFEIQEVQPAGAQYHNKRKLVRHPMNLDQLDVDEGANQISISTKEDLKDMANSLDRRTKRDPKLSQPIKQIQVPGAKLQDNKSFSDVQNYNNYDLAAIQMHKNQPLKLGYDVMISERAMQLHHATKEKELVKPKEYGTCSLTSISKLTQFLELLRLSDIKILGGNKIVMQQHNPVDVKPKSTNMIQPGDGFVPAEKPPTAQDSDIDEPSKERETLAMLDHLANRQFIVRRGRNNRILTKAIMRNIFDDNQADPEANEKLTARNNRGQNHYLNKYEKLWSTSRASSKEDLYKLEPSRKRAKKSSVFETCLEDLPPSFQQYAL